LFHLQQQVDLLVRRQGMECRPMRRPGFRIQGLQSALPRCPLPRHVLGSEAVLDIVQQFRVDQRGDRDRRPVRWLASTS
jgi:hypothetical protein